MGQVVEKSVDSYIYQPPETSYDEIRPKKLVVNDSKDGVLHLHLFSSANKCRTTIIYCHGNATDLGMSFSGLSKLHEKLPDLNLVSFEYPGYGLLKDEKASEGNLTKRLTVTINFCKRTFRCRNEDIFLYGMSLGTGVSVFVASRFPGLGGLILEAPFYGLSHIVSGVGELGGGGKSVKSVAKKVGELFIKAFRSFENIQRIDCPVLIIHGLWDHVVSSEHTKRLWVRIPKVLRFKRVYVKKGNHNNCIEEYGYEEFSKLVKELIHASPRIREEYGKVLSEREKKVRIQREKKEEERRRNYELKEPFWVYFK